jgi:hypothetical protein
MQKDHSVQLLIIMIFGAILFMIALSSCGTSRASQGYHAPKTWHCVVGKHRLQ